MWRSRTRGLEGSLKLTIFPWDLSSAFLKPGPSKRVNSDRKPMETPPIN